MRLLLIGLLSGLTRLAVGAIRIVWESIGGMLRGLLGLLRRLARLILRSG